VQPATPNTPSTDQTPRPSFCTNCGTPLGQSPAHFCGNCGARIEPAVQASPLPDPVGEPVTRAPTARSLRDNTLALTAILVGVFLVVGLIIAANSQGRAGHLSDEERKNLVAYFVGLGDSSYGIAAKEATCTAMYEGFQAYPTVDPEVWWRDIATYAQAKTVAPSEVRQAFAGLCQPYVDTTYQGNAKDASARD